MRRLCLGFILWILSIPCGHLAAQPSNEPDPKFWVPDGDVYAMAATNGIVYLGGTFEHVGLYTGGYGVANATNGVPIAPSFSVDGIVRAMISDGAGGLFIAGQFSQVGNVSTTNIAHLDVNRQPDPAFTVSTDGEVLALAMIDGRVLAGGTFSIVDGQPRTGLAAFLAATAVLDPLDAHLDGPVRAMTILNNRLFIGGGFLNAGAVGRPYAAALDMPSGVLATWKVRLNSSGTGGVSAFAIAGTTIYIAGDFTMVGAVSRQGLAAFETGNAVLLPWQPPLLADAADRVVSMLAIGNQLYVGGRFGNRPGATRSGLAAIDRQTGSLAPWNPGLTNGWVSAMSVEGTSLHVAGNFVLPSGTTPMGWAALALTTGQPLASMPAPKTGVLCILHEQGAVNLGGEFLFLGGRQRSRLAAIDLATGQPTPWAPQVTGESVTCMAVNGSVLYVGGSFSGITGQSRTNLAALNTTDGGLLPFVAEPSTLDPAGTPSRMRIWEGDLMVSVPYPRNSGALFDGLTGRHIPMELTSVIWHNNLSAWTVDGGRLVTAEFNTLRGSGPYLAFYDRQTLGPSSRMFPMHVYPYQLLERDHEVYAFPPYWALSDIPGFDMLTGRALPWITNAQPYFVDACSGRDAIYVAGAFSSIGDQPRTFAAGFDPLTAALKPWSPRLSAQRNGAHTILSTESHLLLGGSLPQSFAAFPVTNPPPEVQILLPSPEGSLVAGASLSLSIQATFNPDPSATIELYLDHKRVTQLPAGQFSWTWDVPKLIGDHLLAVAVRGSDGSIASSSEQRVSIGLPPDYREPTLDLTFPVEGGVYQPGVGMVVAGLAHTPTSVISLLEVVTQDSKRFQTATTGEVYSANLGPLQPGDYAVTANLVDDYGTKVTRGPVHFHVNSLPQVILERPAATTFPVGSNVLLRASASDADGTIQSLVLEFGGTPLLSTTNDTCEYSCANLPPGGYTVRATARDDSGGSSASWNYQLTVVPPLNVTRTLQPETAFLGEDFRLEVGLDYSELFTYTWYKNGSVLTNATNNFLAFSRTKVADGGLYKVVIKSPLQKYESPVILLEVANPSAGATPVGLTGWNVNVVVGADGSGPTRTNFDFTSTCWFEAGWKAHLDGLPPSRMLTSGLNPNVVFQLQPYTTSNALWVATHKGARTATLTVADPAAYTHISILASAGWGPTFGNLVFGFDDGSKSDPLPIYMPDWLEKGPTRSAGGFGRAYKSVYDSAQAQLFQADFDLQELGLDKRKLVDLTFTTTSIERSGTPSTIGIMAVSGVASAAAEPSIAFHPQDVSTSSGGAVALEALAVGRERLHYQWQFNGTNLADGDRVRGANSRRLTISRVGPNDEGAYEVLASNDMGSARSRQALLQVTNSVSPPGYAHWMFSVPTRIHSVPASGADGTVYVAAYPGVLYAINPNGDLRWYAPLPTNVSATTTVGLDGTVYVGFGVSKGLGVVLGKNGMPRPQPPVTNATVTIARTGGLLAQDATGMVTERDKDGTVRWSLPLSAPAWSTAALAPDGGRYLLSYTAGSGEQAGSRLWAFAKDGAVRWTIGSTNAWSRYPAIGPDGSICVWTPANGGVLMVLGPNGDLKREIPAPNLIPEGVTIAGDGTIYAASGSPGSTQVTSISNSGATKWAMQLGLSAEIGVPTIGADGHIYCVLPLSLRALSEDGTVLWIYGMRSGGGLLYSPVLDQTERLFVESSTTLYCIQASSGPARAGWPMFLGNAQRSGRALGCQLQMDPNTGGQITVDGEPGYSWRIESQDALGGSTWKTEAVVPVIDAPVPWPLPTTPETGTRFFRAVLDR